MIKGDKLKCVEWAFGVSEGKIYEITKVIEDKLFYIINDYGEEVDFNFEDVCDYSESFFNFELIED